MGSVMPFPCRRPDLRDMYGTIHVSGDRVDGFQVSHEGSSGNSWGEVRTYATGQEAITAAYALNRDSYFSACDINVCDAAIEDGCPGVGLVSLPGDF